MNLIDQVRITSRLENISVVESKVETLKSELELEDAIYGNVMLAVVEAVTNAIQHGNRYSPEKKVTFETPQEYSQPALHHFRRRRRFRPDPCSRSDIAGKYREALWKGCFPHKEPRRRR